MKCVFCDGVNQLVAVDGIGQVCVTCYPKVKRGKSAPTEVKTVYCENCHSSIIVRGRCIQCGNHVSSTGEMIRVGGHEDC